VVRGAHDDELCVNLRCNLWDQLSGDALDDIQIGCHPAPSKFRLQGLACFADRGMLTERALRVRAAIDQIGSECRDKPGVDTMEYRQLGVGGAGLVYCDGKRGRGVKGSIDGDENPVGGNPRPGHEHRPARALDDSFRDVAEKRVSYSMMHMAADDQQRVLRNGNACENQVRQTSFDDYGVSAPRAAGQRRELLPDELLGVRRSIGVVG
jgi:hypothetical protein